MRITSCLTIHAFVSKLAKVAAAVIAQPVGAVYAGGVWSTGLCGGPGDKYTKNTVIFKKISYLLEHIIVLLTTDLVQTAGMKRYQIPVQSYLV